MSRRTARVRSPSAGSSSPRSSTDPWPRSSTDRPVRAPPARRKRSTSRPKTFLERSHLALPAQTCPCRSAAPVPAPEGRQPFRRRPGCPRPLRRPEGRQPFRRRPECPRPLRRPGVHAWIMRHCPRSNRAVAFHPLLVWTTRHPPSQPGAVARYPHGRGPCERHYSRLCFKSATELFHDSLRGETDFRVEHRA
jgi:hypothetical protein